MANRIDEEKNDGVLAQHNERVEGEESPTPPTQEPRELIHMEKSAEKKLIRRVDIRLLPILGLLYSIALIDRMQITLNIGPTY
jgi:hypothetical protein